MYNFRGCVLHQFMSISFLALGPLAALLHAVSAVHPLIERVLVEADGHSWPGRPEPTGLHGAVEGRPLYIAIASRLFIREVGARYGRCSHGLYSCVVCCHLRRGILLLLH